MSISPSIPLSFTLPTTPLSIPERRRPQQQTARIFLSPTASHKSLPTSAIIPTALAAALLCTPLSSHAKTPLTENTILRRYLVTDSDSILRYSLPLPSERLPGSSTPPIRRVQELLERLGVDVRARGAAGLINGRRDLAKLRQVLDAERLDILLDVPAKKRTAAADYMSRLEACIAQIEDELGLPPPLIGASLFPKEIVAVQETLQDVVQSRNSMTKRTNFDGLLIDSLRRDALGHVANIEELAVSGSGLPYRIPRRYNIRHEHRFPRLVGRATVELRLVKNKEGVWSDKDGKAIGKEVTLLATLDGYSAPLTAGNFVDLAQRGYYNNTQVLVSQRSFYAQLGERTDDDFNGFKDPKSGMRRQIPMEILVAGDPSPTYGGTLDELGIGDLQPVLPISAYGAMAMVHSVEDSNDASSQFYFFLLDPTSYQARSFGGSALTGSVSTFGYVTQGKEFLSQLGEGDKVARVKVVGGEENFHECGEC